MRGLSSGLGRLKRRETKFESTILGKSSKIFNGSGGCCGILEI